MIEEKRDRLKRIEQEIESHLMKLKVMSIEYNHNKGNVSAEDCHVMKCADSVYLVCFKDENGNDVSENDFDVVLKKEESND